MKNIHREFMSKTNARRLMSAVIRVLACSLGLLALPAVSLAATIYGVMAPLSLDFSSVPVGTTSPAQVVTFVSVYSFGGEIVNDLSNYNGASSGDFAIGGPCNGGSAMLADPGDRCIYTITFTPTATGSRSGTLWIHTQYSGDFSIPLTGTGTMPADSIAIDPVVQTTLYSALEGSGVYKSIDSGANWTPATTQPTNTRVKALVISKTDRSTLYVASNGGGVYLSSNGGVTWSACATQPANLNLRSLAIDASGKLYAGSEAGVFASSDGCATWSAMNNGLPTP